MGLLEVNYDLIILDFNKLIEVKMLVKKQWFGLGWSTKKLVLHMRPSCHQNYDIIQIHACHHYGFFSPFFFLVIIFTNANGALQYYYFHPYNKIKNYFIFLFF